MVYFHGNAGNLANRAERFRQFRRRGYGLIVPAYRGSSGSTGTPSQGNIESDMALVLESFAAGTPLIYYGESLGAAVAIHATSHRPPTALILESPFTSIPDVAALHYPGLVERARNSGNTWPSLTRIAQLETPLLILHGARDALIPPAMGRALYSASPSGDKQILIVDGAGHLGVWQPEARRALYRFIDRF